jgi:outer membrane protein OmpA-like peptidoglycan-associated protein
MLEASRLAADRARRDADLLRLQTLVREEEAQLQSLTEREATAQATAEAEAATAEAAQANRLAAARAHEVELARKEAELAAAVAAQGDTGPADVPASRRVGGKNVYTLDGDVFPVGSAQLTQRGLDTVRALAAAVPAGSRLRIAAYTDAQGADDANRLLSQRRADAVRRALAAGGIAPSRLEATGKGEADPSPRTPAPPAARAIAASRSPSTDPLENQPFGPGALRRRAAKSLNFNESFRSGRGLDPGLPRGPGIGRSSTCKAACSPRRGGVASVSHAIRSAWRTEPGR